jgi:hypothetical protein
MFEKDGTQERFIVGVVQEVAEILISKRDV